MEEALGSFEVRILGIRLAPLSDEEIVLVTAEAIRLGRQLAIGNQNLHSLYLSLRDPEMRSFYKSAALVHIDGMGVIFLANILGVRLKRIHRATSLDFMPLLYPKIANEGWRVFYLGGKPGVAEKGAEALRSKYHGVQIRVRHGYFDSAETDDVIHEINEYKPHILMIGMGMPLQEKWILRHQSKISANVIFPVGAYMDYQAAEVPTAPRWLALLYLEWLYRLATEPRRLWHRYLVEPWMLLGLLMYQTVVQWGRLTEAAPALHMESSVRRQELRQFVRNALITNYFERAS